MDCGEVRPCGLGEAVRRSRRLGTWSRPPSIPTAWRCGTPGTGTRNTVHRGPRRDLIGEIADAVEAAGLRFGVYYSGGLDWSITDLPPLTSHLDVLTLRPNDAAYNVYAVLHVRNLIGRYQPDVLWNDINWPDAGKRTGPVVATSCSPTSTRAARTAWSTIVGPTTWDFRTSEYEAFRNESEVSLGELPRDRLSFGYNQAEDERQILSGRQLACT